MALVLASQADYEAQLGALRPPGPAWPEQDPNVSAAAEECAIAHGRAVQLVEESDPRTTVDLLSDWERVAALPDSCVSGIDQTASQRRAALLARLTAVGGQSRAYFIAVAESLGYEITITEYRPHTVADDVEHELVDDPWAHAWRVNAPPSTVAWLTVEDTVADPLAWWGIVPLECLIGRLKPAHTTVLWALISYSDDEPATDLYDDAAVYGRDSTAGAIDRLNVLLNETMPQSAYW